MSVNEAIEMPAFDSTPSTPIHGVTNPLDAKVSIRAMVEQVKLCYYFQEPIIDDARTLDEPHSMLASLLVRL